MDHREYYAYIDEAIKSVASKADLLMFPDKKVLKKNPDLISQVHSLYCLWLATYRVENAFFKAAIENIKSCPDRKEIKKATASYFTPKYIAIYMVKSTLGPLTDKILRSKKKNKIEQLQRLKICDPCCGGGIFLICAHDYVVRKMLIANRIQKKKIDKSLIPKLASKTVYGVDINPDAVEATKTLLQMNILKWEIKPRLKEIVNSAEFNSFLQKDKCDNDLKNGQSIVQDHVQEKHSTKGTIKKSGKQKAVNSAKKNLESQNSTTKSDSVHQNVLEDLDTAIQQKDFLTGESA